jgi:hypothetical protein
MSHYLIAIVAPEGRKWQLKVHEMHQDKWIPWGRYDSAVQAMGKVPIATWYPGQAPDEFHGYGDALYQVTRKVES